MIRYRCANVKPRDNIQAWINHLVLNTVDTSATSGSEPATFLAGKDKVYKFMPLPGSKKHLQKILLYYWHGLSEPLHFFPHSSFAFANEIFKGKNSDQALRKARVAWEGSAFSQGEKNDPYFGLCFKETEPFSRQFIDLAKELFLPLLEQQERYNP
jgi:exodeoxyribonuclease V gamma subunit